MPKFYTYLIGWSSYQKFYYGVRYANNADPADLMVTYFTSSRSVKNFINKHGLPDVIQVRKTFITKEDARNWENRALRRLGIPGNDKFLNRTNNYAFRAEFRTPEHQAKLNAALKGRVSTFKGKTHSLEKRAQISASRKGQITSRIYSPLTDDVKSKISESKTGKTPDRSFYTEEHKEKNSSRSYESGFNKIIAGTIWINNGVVNKRIKPEELESYPGFTKGRDRSL